MAERAGSCISKTSSTDCHPEPEAKDPALSKDSSGFFAPLRMTPVKPLLIAQANTTAANFYERFDNKQFNLFHTFLSDTRPDDFDSVRRLFERVKIDKGEEYAYAVIKRYYVESIRRNPISWKTLGTYVKLHEALARSEEQLFVAIDTFVQQQVNGYIQSNLDDCPDEYKMACDGVDKPQGLFERIKRHWQEDGASGLLRIAISKFAAKIGPTGAASIGEEYKTGHIGYAVVPGSLPGYTIEDISLNGKKVAVIITGDPRKGARVGMDMSIGGGVTIEKVEENMGNRLQYQGPASLQHGEKMPMELMIFKGEAILDKPPDAKRRDGYIIVTRDGRLNIADKRNLRLSDITGEPKDDWVVMDLRGTGSMLDVLRFRDEMQKAGASEASTTLHLKDGTVEWSNNSETQERRLLAELGDGRFAVISTFTTKEKDGISDGQGTQMKINDLLQLLVHIGESRGGIRSAVYLDTGHYDWTSYYTYKGGTRARTVIGHPDDGGSSQMCRLYFYQGD